VLVRSVFFFLMRSNTQKTALICRIHQGDSGHTIALTAAELLIHYTKALPSCTFTRTPARTHLVVMFSSGSEPTGSSSSSSSSSRRRSRRRRS